MVLQFPVHIEALEADKKWTDVAEFLFRSWLQEKNNCSLLLATGTELWYLLVYGEDVLEIKCIEYDDYMHKLIEITNYGMRTMRNDVWFCCIFGYMIDVMPYFFVDHEHGYEHWEKLGKSLLKEAFEKQPTDPITRLIYYRSIDDDRGDQKIPLALACEYFSCNTAVGEYFINVLT